MMLLTFWLIAGGLTALAIAFVVLPLLRVAHDEEQVEQRAANIAIYKARLQELAQEDLTPEQRAQAKQELDKVLLQEVPSEADAAINRPAKRAWVSSLIVFIAIPALAVWGYWHYGSPALIQPPTQEAAAANNAQLPENFAAQVDQLAIRLQNEPDNTEGWYVLARSYSLLTRYDDAVKAYNHLLGIVGTQEPLLLTELAEAMAMANGENLIGQPTLLLEAALKINPNAQRTLWLYGLSALQQKKATLAISTWEKLLAQLPESEIEQRQAVLASIQDAQRAAGLPVTVALSAPITPVAEPQTVTAPTTVAPPAGRVTVTVELAPALQTAVLPTDTVFVFARGEGMRMPLAIFRTTAAQFPLTVTLDDSMSMMPAMKLSTVPRIQVVARVSRSGAATPQTGDLQGETAVFSLTDQQAVKVIVEKKVE